ncbi:hypothetical protein RB2654_14000 [Rhodobacterales bacterium HTCC2654]|uniref:Uncharacterized protein n=1 Tax=Maritimibacter alkaliphilus HTCC2654 TaxID=314271 RepID=A3VGJ9_9RHOB|nr:hypothetical protein RB2654_14000 [Rhodobacterales bacterium HTCC2654] [Maritimibacter alkaliphilus HTCC2654]
MPPFPAGRSCHRAHDDIGAGCGS